MTVKAMRWLSSRGVSGPDVPIAHEENRGRDEVMWS